MEKIARSRSAFSLSDHKNERDRSRSREKQKKEKEKQKEKEKEKDKTSKDHDTEPSDRGTQMCCSFLMLELCSGLDYTFYGLPAPPPGNNSLESPTPPAASIATTVTWTCTYRFFIQCCSLCVTASQMHSSLSSFPTASPQQPVRCCSFGLFFSLCLYLQGARLPISVHPPPSASVARQSLESLGSSPDRPGPRLLTLHGVSTSAGSTHGQTGQGQANAGAGASQAQNATSPPPAGRGHNRSASSGAVLSQQAQLVQASLVAAAAAATGGAQPAQTATPSTAGTAPAQTHAHAHMNGHSGSPRIASAQAKAQATTTPTTQMRT